MIEKVQCILLATVLGIVLSLSVYAQTPADKNDTLTLNLKDTDIHSLIEVVSVRTGKNFIVDPRIKAKVTVISSGPINGEKLYQIFLSILAHIIHEATEYFKFPSIDAVLGVVWSAFRK